MACEYELIVKSLNGELTSIAFDKPHQQLLSIFLKIWEECGIQYNHFIFENDENEKIEITNVHSEYDLKNKHEMFVGGDDYFKRCTIKGAFRVIDLERFGRCNILCTPKEPNFLVYYKVNKDKNGKDIMCLDLNDLKCHKNISEFSVDYYRCKSMLKNGKYIRIGNNNFRYIDISSFTNEHPNAFRSGSNVFETTLDKVDQYIASHAYSEFYIPSYLSKTHRSNFSINPFISLINKVDQ